jgi:hypothetical protein
MGLFIQVAVAQAAIAVSVFSLITYLWLGLTVLLNGDRASLLTWVGGIGLLLAAVFFLCHGALVGAGVPGGASPTDFWWRLAWVPAFAAPLFWAAIGLHYAGLFGPWRRFRLAAIEGVGALGALAALLALFSWPAIAHYGDFIRLLDASLRVRKSAPPAVAPPALWLLSVAFVVYLTACAFLPWVSLAAARRLATRKAPSRFSASGVHQLPSLAAPPPAEHTGGRVRSLASGDAALLWDARDAWARARPALLTASVLMMATGLIVAALGILTSLATHGAIGAPIFVPRLPVPRTRPGHVPVELVATDLVVQLALAGVGLAVGWAVVRQGILVERRLPQRGFLSHWRGMAICAAVFAAVIAAMGSIQPVALPELLVLVALVSAAYALFTWQSYVAHDRMLAQLRPFVASLAVEQRGWLAVDPAELERSVAALFTSLCRDVLGASRARLSLSAGRLHRTFTYEAAELPEDARDQREWALPVTDERGVVARLVLGARVDGAGYTSADLEVARACGQRILDAVGEFAAGQAIAALARQRGLEAELSAALPRRVLHDEVLPRLHLAMLRLEALRARVPMAGPVAGLATSVSAAAPSPGMAAATTPAGAAPSAPTEQHGAVAATGALTAVAAQVVVGGDGSRQPESRPESDLGMAPDSALGGELAAVVHELGQAHRDLAALMRAAPIVNQRRLEHGLVSALRAALDGEFRGSFDQLELDLPPEAAAAADALSPLAADLLLGAAFEAIRNAGRHARGGDLHRRLAMRVALVADESTVGITVRDDGVGLQSDVARAGSNGEPIPTGTVLPGARSGLLTHGALIGLIGGTLSVQSRADVTPDAPTDPAREGADRARDVGTTVTIRVPRAGVTPQTPTAAE